MELNPDNCTCIDTPFLVNMIVLKKGCMVSPTPEAGWQQIGTTKLDLTSLVLQLPDEAQL